MAEGTDTGGGVTGTGSRWTSSAEVIAQFKGTLSVTDGGGFNRFGGENGGFFLGGGSIPSTVQKY